MPSATGVPRLIAQASARHIQPTSTRFELAPNQGGVKRRFLAYSSPSCLPDPNHLAVLARPVVVGAAPTLTSTTRLGLPPAAPPCCDRAGGEGLSPPLEPQRLTAHAHVEAYLCDDHARRWREPARCADRRPPRRPENHHALRP